MASSHIYNDCLRGGPVAGLGFYWAALVKMDCLMEPAQEPILWGELKASRKGGGRHEIFPPPLLFAMADKREGRSLTGRALLAAGTSWGPLLHRSLKCLHLMRTSLWSQINLGFLIIFQTPIQDQYLDSGISQNTNILGCVFLTWQPSRQVRSRVVFLQGLTVLGF